MIPSYLSYFALKGFKWRQQWYIVNVILTLRAFQKMTIAQNLDAANIAGTEEVCEALFAYFNIF